jgi:hypothetical protein
LAARGIVLGPWSLPVIGIGVLSVIETPALAEAIFAAIALIAIAVDVRRASG